MKIQVMGLCKQKVAHIWWGVLKSINELLGSLTTSLSFWENWCITFLHFNTSSIVFNFKTCMCILPVLCCLCYSDFKGCFCPQDELKTKWEKEKSILEESKAHAEKKYKELDEQVILCNFVHHLVMNG